MIHQEVPNEMIHQEVPNDWKGQCFGCSTVNSHGLGPRFYLLSEHGCYRNARYLTTFVSEAQLVEFLARYPVRASPQRRLTR